MKEFLNRCRQYFYYVAFFSLFVNLLMLTLPVYMLQMFDKVIPSRSNETLVMLTLAAVFALTVMMLLEMLRARIMLGAGVAMDGLLGPPVLQGVLANAVRPGLNLSPAGLRDVAVMRGFLTGNGIFAMFDAPWVPIFIVLIFMFHPYLGWVAIAGAVILLALGFINDRLTRGVFDEMSKGQRKAGGYIDAGVRNAEVVNALGMVGDLTRHWQGLNAGVLDAQVRAGRRSTTISSVTRFSRMGIQIIAMATGIMLVIDQHVTTGIMLASGLILGRALGPVEHAISTWKQLVDAMEAYRNLKGLLEGEHPLEEGMELPKPQGKLDVERVIFSVPGNDRPILKGVTFALVPGESMGLIGPSAAGKSTLARLITGIWRPTSGLIRLDGADVSRWPRQQLGPHIGYLPQDVELFGGTVAQNIARLGEPDPEAVLAAAKRAQIHDMVLKLPHGYDTEIGPSGAVLSAGQRQRVALARAMYGDPRIVVLDEPNANLDTEGEEALVLALQALRDDKVTVIVISHRPSLLGSVDKLLILREGQADAFGPRADIMARIAPRAAAVPADGPQRLTRGERVMDMPVSGKLGKDLHPAAHIGRFAKMGVIAIGTLFIGLFLWAAFAPLSGAILASGFVKVDLNRKTVQHLEGGIVREILVRDGDTVKEGQTLIVLQDERVSASVDLIEGQWQTELAKAARLQAQREGADHIQFPDKLMQHSGEQQVADVIRGETVYFDAKRETLQNQIDLLQQQISQAREEIAARQEQMASEAKAAGYLKEEIAANEKLVAQNNVAKVQLLTLRRQFEEYEARHGEQEAQLASNRQRITELNLKIVGLKNDYTEAAANELNDVKANIYDLEERLRPSLDAQLRQTVVAPISGTVINMKVFTIGGVIGPREPILDIVPFHNALVIEAKLPVDGIDDVHLGQIADIRLTAYKTRTTPLISGKLIYIAADRLVDEKTGDPYYLAHIEVDKESMKKAPELELYPGMPADIFIRTGTRTALDYLLAPIEATLRRSLRES